MQDAFSIKPINTFLKDCIADRNTVSYDEKNVHYKNFIDKNTKQLESKIDETNQFQFKKKIESLEEEIKFLRENNNRLNKNNFELEEKLDAERKKKPKFLEKIDQSQLLNSQPNNLNKNFSSLLNEKKEKSIQTNLPSSSSQLQNESISAGLFIPNLNVDHSSKLISENNPVENIFSPLKLPNSIKKIKSRINLILKQFQNIAKKSNLDCICLILSFPYSLSDHENDVMIFQDLGSYNLAKFSKFQNKTNYSSSFSLFESTINEKEFLIMIMESLKLDESFLKTDECKALMSLYREIPVENNYQATIQSLEKANNFDKVWLNRYKKSKTELENLKTRFCLFWMESRLRSTFQFFKLFSVDEKLLYITMQMRMEPEKLTQTIAYNKNFFYSLNSLSLNLFFLDIFDKTLLNLRLKVEMMKNQITRKNSSGTNKINPIHASGANLVVENDKNEENKFVTPDLESNHQTEYADRNYKKTFFNKLWRKILDRFDFGSKIKKLRDKMSKNNKIIFDRNDEEVLAEFTNVISALITENVFLNHEKMGFDLYNIENVDEFIEKNIEFLDFYHISEVFIKGMNIFKEEMKKKKSKLNYSQYENFWKQKKILLPANVSIRTNYFSSNLNIEFYKKFFIKPEKEDQNFLHSLFIYHNFKINENNDKTSEMEILIPKWQMIKFSLNELKKVFNFSHIRHNKILKDIFSFDNLSFQDIASDDLGLFKIFSKANLWKFYKKMNDYMDLRFIYYLFLNEYFLLFIPFFMLPALVNYILHISFEKASPVSKLTFFVYAIYVLLFFLTYLRYFVLLFNKLNSSFGNVDCTKELNENKFKNLLEDEEEVERNILEFGKMLPFKIRRILFLSFLVFFFLFACTLKVVSTFVLNILKLSWVENKITEYNEVFDFNQFILDLIDYLISEILNFTYYYVIVHLNLTTYIENEKKIKELMILFQRLISYMNGFFLIIFILNPLRACAKDDCHSMLEQMYKNTILIIFVKEIIKFIISLISFQQNKSFQRVLNNRLADVAANQSKVLHYKKSIQKTPKNNKENHDNILPINNFITRILYNKTLNKNYSRIWYIDKTLLVFSDFCVYICYFVSNSASFSLDIFFLYACLFLKAISCRMDFYYSRSGFFESFQDYNIYKFFISFTFAVGTIFSVGGTILIYSSFDVFFKAEIFFSISGFIIALNLFYIWIRSNISRRTKSLLIENQEVLQDLFQAESREK